MNDLQVDILIVGAGPVGLFGAYYAGFRGLRVAVMDSLPELGGQISAMYPEKQIFDVAGFPSVRGRDLVANLREQADRFDPVYLLGHRADSLAKVDAGFAVTSQKGTRVTCGAVVVTGGIGTFTPRPLPAGSEFEGRGLAYFVPDPDSYAGKDVVIVGGGDSAFDWALGLEPIARSVTAGAPPRGVPGARTHCRRGTAHERRDPDEQSDQRGDGRRPGRDGARHRTSPPRPSGSWRPRRSSPRSASPPTSARCSPGASRSRTADTFRSTPR